MQHCGAPLQVANVGQGAFVLQKANVAWDGMDTCWG
ncbi:hypothetical protein [Sporisorium scitamineum]|uniref:Uncharacterized protein n=1 Tax=Sporisorium scitamineum TaxID=49012 RepID=A0A0F7SBI0_9BASI|nr:hypothetical protein [Sporisorium scitamineum]